MNLLDSRTGRAIRALRRGHIAAEAFGVQTPRAKLLVFIYAAVLAGLSGWLYAHFQRAVNPTPFGAEAGIEYLFIAVVGGAGYVWGGVLGAAIVVILKEILQSYLPYLFHGEGQLETIVFGILLVTLLQLAPTGVWPWLTARLPFRPARRPPDTSLLLPARPRADDQRSDAAGDQPCAQAVRRRDRGQRCLVRRPGRRDRGADRPERRRQEHDLQPDHRRAGASGGTISVLGTSIDKAPPQQVVKLGIARTFQHVKLVPDMTVLENVAIGAHLRGRAGALASMFRLDRADEAKLLAEAARQIARVGLADRIDQPAGSLSLGQQRIVEIARALCVDPNLLLLDEPAAGLRHMEKQRLATLLRALRDGGMSVLLVEHDMGFVMDLADRIVVLDFGTKIAEGTPQAIKTNPDVIKAYLGGVRSAGMSALLSVSDVHVAYGKVEAVRAVSLEVADHEIVTIIGANGAGKTTLLNAIMGILPLTGRAGFAGTDMAPLDIEDRVAAGLSLVPEHRELFGSMNVEDNLQLGAFRVTKVGRGRRLRAGLHAVSAAEGETPAIGGDAVGRRAADAGDGPRLDGRAAPADAGRAEPRACADHCRRHLPHHRRIARERRVGAAGRAERAGRAADRRPRLCDGARRIHPERTGERDRSQPARHRQLSRLPARRRERGLEGHTRHCRRRGDSESSS